MITTDASLPNMWKRGCSGLCGRWKMSQLLTLLSRLSDRKPVQMSSSRSNDSSVETLPRTEADNPQGPRISRLLLETSRVSQVLRRKEARTGRRRVLCHVATVFSLKLSDNLKLRQPARPKLGMMLESYLRKHHGRTISGQSCSRVVNAQNLAADMAC